MTRIIATFFFFFFFSGSVYADLCIEPTKPSQNPPQAPFCASAYGGMRKCQSWEKAQFNDEIIDYKKSSFDYLIAVKKYAGCLVQRAEEFKREQDAIADEVLRETRGDPGERVFKY